MAPVFPLKKMERAKRFELLSENLQTIKAQLIELKASGEDTQRGTQRSELDVFQVLEKWDELPARVKASILQLVKEAAHGGGQ